MSKSVSASATPFRGQWMWFLLEYDLAPNLSRLVAASEDEVLPGSKKDLHSSPSFLANQRTSLTTGQVAPGRWQIKHAPFLCWVR